MFMPLPQRVASYQFDLHVMNFSSSSKAVLQYASLNRILVPKRIAISQKSGDTAIPSWPLRLPQEAQRTHERQASWERNFCEV